MEEKRKFTRIVCKMKASVQIDNLITVDANNLNISLNGALFELADYCAIKKGDNWQLTFILPNSDIRLQFKTEVVHSTGKMVGVKFVPIDAETMIHLKSLMVGRTSNPEQVERELALLYRLNKTI
ncbi:MAG TPA: PilZ domain-containing protein [Geobacteraceae bacterium]|nr:PilZ domain-containing protein [Geobacteraceae bacterium]